MVYSAILFKNYYIFIKNSSIKYAYSKQKRRLVVVSQYYHQGGTTRQKKSTGPFFRKLVFWPL